jgi:hypothetical protein
VPTKPVAPTTATFIVNFLLDHGLMAVILVFDLFMFKKKAFRSGKALIILSYKTIKPLPGVGVAS